MKKIYENPQFNVLSLNTGDILSSSLEGFSIYNLDGVGSGDADGFSFPSVYN